MVGKVFPVFHDSWHHFFFFKFTDTLRNFEDFPDYHESTSRPRINHDFNFTRPVSTTLSPISWVSYPSRQYFNITGSSEKSLAQISWVLWWSAIEANTKEKYQQIYHTFLLSYSIQELILMLLAKIINSFMTHYEQTLKFHHFLEWLYDTFLEFCIDQEHI